VINKDSHVATINDDCNLTFSIIVQKGIGYIPSEDIRDLIEKDYLPMDAFFTPVKKVTYDIEKMLVEDNPNYEKVIFDIQTDGQITPMEALKEAIKIMYAQMSVFNKGIDLSAVSIMENVSDDIIDLKELIIKIDELKLSARSFNSLDKAGVKYIGDIVLMSEVEVKSIKNLGKKSLDEISEKFKTLGFPIDGSLDEDIASALRKKLEQLKV
jgi:DNA-directed RNA polymerase subunit alpha